MPIYEYKIKFPGEEEKIVEVVHSYKYFNQLDTLPEDIKAKISYVDETGNRVWGERIISSSYLTGFTKYGTSKK